MPSRVVVDQDFIKGFAAGASSDEIPRSDPLKSVHWLRGYHAGIVARDRAIDLELFRLKADERASRGPLITPERALATKQASERGDLKR